MVMEIAGYVVQEKNNFLSRKGNFVMHRDRGDKLGMTRAYVHPAEELLKLRKDVDILDAAFYPAIYKRRDYMIVSMRGMGFEEFLEIEKPSSLRCG